MKKIKFLFTSAVFLAVVFLLSTKIYSQVFWNECTTGVTVSLRAVSNYNSYIAYVCGVSGTVIKTTNGGYNWINVTGNGIPTTLTLISIFCIDANNAITAGYTGTNTFVFRTSNGGQNWYQVFAESSGFIDAVWMSTSLNGFMVGDPVGGRWSLWKTTNSGVNWDSSGLYLPQTGTEAGWNSSLWMKGSLIWFGTNNTRIYYSSNNGINWSVQSTTPEINIYSIFMDNPPGVIGLAGGAAFFRTTNGGTNWLPVTITGTGNFNGIAISHMFLNAGWYIRSGNSISYSYYPYTSWYTEYTTSSGTYNHLSITRDTMSYGPGMLYAVKNNGGITRGNLFVEGVKIISNEIPSSFTLHQNYPNPFNPQTKIRLEVPLLKNNKPGEVRGALIKIQVYDVSGKLLETLLDQITQPGIYEKTWNGSNYSSGVYFYRVIIADPLDNSINYTATRKMVLMK